MEVARVKTLWLALALTLLPASAITQTSDGVVTGMVRPLAADGWVPLGPPGGEITHLLVHPRNPQTLWAGTPTAGVFKSIDGGASWNPANQGLDRQDVQALAVAPGSPQILYAAAGGRVYRSENGARTWAAVLSCGEGPPPCPFVSVQQLVVHPEERQTVFATTFRGVFKSVDGGARWRRVRVSASFIYTLAFEPGDPQVLYAAGGGQLFKSLDGGSSWALWNESRIGAVNGQILVIDPRNPRRMWMGGFTSDGVYRSTDGGAHWHRSRSGLTNFTANALALSPAGGPGLPAVWTGNRDGLFRSLNGGVTWEPVLRGRLVAAIATHPRQQATLWAGTRPMQSHLESGVYKSVSRGATWTFSSHGLFMMETFSLAFDPVAPDSLWAASGQGVRHSADGGATWTERSGNLPRHVLLTAVATDPHDPGTVWTGTTAGVFVTEDGGATWEGRSEGLPAPDATVHLLRIAPSDPDVAYVASQEKLFRTVDAGRHWTFLPAPPIPAILRSGDLWVDPRDPDVLFASRGALWISRDGGASWSEVPLGNGTGGFRAVAADPRDPDVLYAGGDQGVFRSTDGGQAWQHVTLRPATLLTVGLTGEVWIETNRRIFFSPDGISGWDLLPGLTQFDGLSVLAADPHDPGTVFAGGSFLMSGNLVRGLFLHTGD